MSTKPTPGPYKITNSFEILSVQNEHTTPIARFMDGWVGHEEAEANARAWVEGREAMEKLKELGDSEKAEAMIRWYFCGYIKNDIGTKEEFTVNIDGLVKMLALFVEAKP